MSGDHAPPNSKRSWATFIPRPSSSSGRPSSSSGTTLAKLKNDAQSDSPLSDSSPNAVFAASSVASPSPSFSLLDSSSGSRPTTPKRWNTNFLLTSPKSSQALDQQASQVILNALERTTSQQATAKSPESKNSGHFGKSFSSMMGSLSLSRTTAREEDKVRGRSMTKMKRVKSASQTPAEDLGTASRSISRARSQSPFSFRRFRRESSPTPQAIPMSHSDAELSDSPSSVLPRSTAFNDDDSGDETVLTDAETDDGWSTDQDIFDPITERNTECNALIPPVADAFGAPHENEDPDPVGEGVNIIVAPEPYFPSSLNTLGTNARGKRNPRRKKSVRAHEPLPFTTSRPVFQRDRCTITITQGDPEAKLGDRRKRIYVVASDLSEESRYAVEWGIGTVLRDGDDMLIVTVVENEAKVDPPLPNTVDRATKLRSQQERQGLAYILVRQVTGLLQRTKLNVTISCQAWHAKNARHMLLDVVDHVEPTMLIVGSRGLGQLNGILLGSTSHYLIQKCSVPVMVARRRLKRPPKRSAHLSTHRTHISLAEAGIDRVAHKVDEDVQMIRDELKKDENRREGGPGGRNNRRFGDVNEEEQEHADDDELDDDEDPDGVKVAG